MLEYENQSPNVTKNIQIKWEYFLFISIFHILTKKFTKKNINGNKGYKINVENTHKYRGL
jgi:predicted component of viral defense system (DUF524 family)